MVVKNPLVVSRMKDSETLRKKMEIKSTGDIFSIKDVYGVRIIVESVKDAYIVLGKISTIFSGFLKNDFIGNPKTRPNEPNFEGKMLRLIQFIAYRNGVPFEIQITTRVFHEMNEPLHERYHRSKYYK